MFSRCSILLHKAYLQAHFIKACIYHIWHHCGDTSSLAPSICFTSHTPQRAHPQLLLYPKPHKVCASWRITRFIGVQSLLHNLARLLFAAGLTGCHVFCSFLHCLQELLFVRSHAHFLQSAPSGLAWQEKLIHFTMRPLTTPCR